LLLIFRTLASGRRKVAKQRKETSNEQSLATPTGQYKRLRVACAWNTPKKRSLLVSFAWQLGLYSDFSCLCKGYFDFFICSDFYKKKTKLTVA
jgi:hypothetical protein